MPSQPVPPPSPPSVVHIGFEPCRRSGYEGRTCVTMDRSLRFLWLAMTCLDNNGQFYYGDCIDLSDSMKQFAYQRVSNRDVGYYVWNVRAKQDGQSAPPPTANTSSEYLFVVKQGYTFYPKLDKNRSNEFMHWWAPRCPNHLTHDYDSVLLNYGLLLCPHRRNYQVLQIVWLLPPPPLPPPSLPPFSPSYVCEDINLRRGWQYISFNCLPHIGKGLDLLDQVDFSPGDYIRSRNKDLIFEYLMYTTSGYWHGGLSELAFTNGYHIYFNKSSSNSSIITQQGGLPQQPLQNVSLKPGWNYIGHAPFSSCLVDDLEVLEGQWTADTYIITLDDSGEFS